ncbi:hypothetical protein VM1G_02473 [Cytospora mali]|uniref:Protein kinase domain-containing protein n=1 Tax=Cytospora mali TaxID=578113 RepID=A0A194VT59_CYTMA|nr:hypothetical protein VM1G_02473 [Valsa mali]
MFYARHSTSRKDKPPNRSTWLAPEVITSSEEIPYTNKADIWALAVSWLYAFKRPSDVAEIEASAIVRAVQDIVLPDDLLSLRGLWLQMLVPDPAGRSSVQEALAHEVWQKAKGTKGEDETREPVGGVKRVRLLSPEGGD